MNTLRCTLLISVMGYSLFLFAQPGSLDPTFGTGGRVLSNLGHGNERMNAVVVQPDGKVVSGGHANYLYSFTGAFLLTRYTSDGILDTDFGSDGIVSTAINAGDIGWDVSNGSDSEISDLVLLPDGRILAVGRSFTFINSSGLNRLALAMYNADGSLDTGFGNNGWVVDLDVYSVNAYADVLDDGRIVVACSGYGPCNVLRYLANGDRDTSFDGDGLLPVQVNAYPHEVRGMAVLPDGRIVVGGYVYNGTDEDIFLVRLNSDGTPDLTFNGTGSLLSAPGIAADHLNDMVVEEDGTVTLAGSTVLGEWITNFLVQRFLPDGTPDASFGIDGTTTLDPGQWGGQLAAIDRMSDGSYVVAGSAEGTVAAHLSASGQWDNGFGTAGLCAINVSPHRLDATDIAVDQQDRAMVVGGVSLNSGNIDFDAGVACVTGAGVLDVTFSVDGTDVMDPNIGGDLGMAIAQQPDGKLVVAAESQQGSSTAMVVARYLTDGTPDPTFGTNGHVVAAFDKPLCIAIQPDGKILVGVDYAFAVYRLNSDGTPDLSFNGSGVVAIYDFLSNSDQGAVRGIAVQPDGRIVAVGFAGIWPSIDKAIAVARFLPSGALDTSFDGDGKQVTNVDPSRWEEGFGVALQADGRILAYGYTETFPGCTLVRYLPDGTPDNSFGGDGIATVFLLNWYSHPNSMVVRPDGRILVASTVVDDNGTTYDYEVALVQVMPDGTPDNSFGTAGVLITDLGGYSEEAFGVVLQPDGKFLVGGYTNNGVDDDFMLLRYTAAGVLDATFGSSGIVTTAFGPSTDRAQALLLQSDGKAVLAGFAVTTSDIDVALARYDVGVNTGIEDLAPDPMEMRVLPSPLSDRSQVVFTLHRASAVSAELVDAQGRVVLPLLRSTELSSGPHSVPLAAAQALAAGWYTVIMHTDEGTRTVRVVH